MNTTTIIRESGPIRKQRSGRVALSLLVLIFVGTSAFAYILTPTPESPPCPYSVTATVVQPAPSETAPVIAPADAATLQNTILSDANLTRAVQLVSPEQEQSQTGGIAGQSLEKLRGKLRVTTTPQTSAGQVEISITYSGRGNPRQACRLVDALADQAARQNTAQRQAAARVAHQDAKKAADTANSQFLKAKADCDAFINRHSTSKLSSTPRSLPIGPVPPGTELSQPTPGLHFDRPDWAEAPESPTLNNPRWAELNNRITMLKNRRDVMLDKMTPAHPSVQNVDFKIEKLEQQLSATPRQLPRPTRDSLPPITPMPPDATDDLLAPGGEGRARHMLAHERPEKSPKGPSLTGVPTVVPKRRAATPAELHPRLAKVYQQKQKVLNLARQKYNRLANLERIAWQNLSSIQPSGVIQSVCPENASESYPDSASLGKPRHLLGALIIALCGTVGIAMFSAGFLPPPCFANAVEVRNSLNVPVVGTMPAADLPGSDAEHLCLPSKNRPVLVASGVIFLVAAAAMIITSFVISSGGS